MIIDKIYLEQKLEMIKAEMENMRAKIKELTIEIQKENQNLIYCQGKTDILEAQIKNRVEGEPIQEVRGEKK